MLDLQNACIYSNFGELVSPKQPPLALLLFCSKQSRESPNVKDIAASSAGDIEWVNMSL